jgi:hypothetical protein
MGISVDFLRKWVKKDADEMAFAMDLAERKARLLAVSDTVGRDAPEPGRGASAPPSEPVLVLQSDFVILWRTRLGTGTATA